VGRGGEEEPREKPEKHRQKKKKRKKEAWCGRLTLRRGTGIDPGANLLEGVGKKRKIDKKSRILLRLREKPSHILSSRGKNWGSGYSSNRPCKDPSSKYGTERRFKGLLSTKGWRARVVAEGGKKGGNAGRSGSSSGIPSRSRGYGSTSE